MKVDKALILAAGKGTRMGEIGKIIPKVLWPIFERSILELEVEYALELGAKEIFVNTHYYAEKVLEFTKGNKTFQKVHVLEEKEAIDIGGAIHNLCSEFGYDGNLLVLNSDQFIFLSNEIWKKAWENFLSNDVLIFTYAVNSSDGYNAIKSNNGLFYGVVENKNFAPGTTIQTYTGMSLIKLSSLKKTPGASKFFDSVASPDERKVYCQSIETSPYWDFGTLPRLWKSYFNILELYKSGKKDLFIDFLLKTKAFIPGKAAANSYNGSGENVVNLTENTVSCSNKIIFGPDPKKELLESDKKGIVFGEILETKIS